MVRNRKIEPKTLAVLFACINITLIIAEFIYLIFRLRDIFLYPYSTVVPHWVEILINIVLFLVLCFILFLSLYLSFATISKLKGHRRPANMYLSEILETEKYPTVTIAIFTFNEPVDMVRESIEKNYFQLKYPKEKLHLIVCDDSTVDDQWKPIADYVKELSDRGYHVSMLHRVVRKGRKAGAFNELINNYAETDYVALADADYVYNSDFLERTLPFFYTEENVFAVQTPQFFKNRNNTWISRLSSNIQEWFYTFLGTYKDKDNSFFFCGTCGIIDLEKAKSVQMEEQAITEDLELSTEAITKQGWVTLYVDHVLSEGVGPENMGQIVGQYLRYSRGNLWSLRQHLGDILLSNKMSFKQKIHYYHNNAALAMGIVQLLVLLEPFLFLVLGISGANIPIIMTLMLFFVGNLLFFLVYRKTFREFMYHLFFMNTITFKLAGQFIKGYILNSPGEFIRTAKIDSHEKSVKKRLKFIFSLFWFEILVLSLLWVFLLWKAQWFTLASITAFFQSVMQRGIINCILQFDIVNAITTGASNFVTWTANNPTLSGTFFVFSYFTFWYVGGFYLTFIGGNHPKKYRVTEITVPMKQDYYGSDIHSISIKKEKPVVKPQVIGLKKGGVMSSTEKENKQHAEKIINKPVEPPFEPIHQNDGDVVNKTPMKPLEKPEPPKPTLLKEPAIPIHYDKDIIASIDILLNQSENKNKEKKSQFKIESPGVQTPTIEYSKPPEHEKNIEEEFEQQIYSSFEKSFKQGYELGYRDAYQNIKKSIDSICDKSEKPLDLRYKEGYEEGYKKAIDAMKKQEKKFIKKNTDSSME